jgi:hypothetical protein
MGKSSAETGGKVGHNAGATKTGRKQHNATTYVNICNYSTPDIVEDRQKTSYIWFWVYIKNAIFNSRIL